MIRDDDGSCLLGIAVHHIVFDGWSEHVLAADLSLAYRARAHGRAPAFERPAPGAGEVAAACRERLTDAVAARQREFWRQSLAGLPDLRLPEPGEGQRADDSATAALEFTVPAADLDPWRQAARDSGATLFTVAIGAYAEALGRLTGQDRFGIGVPVARRDTPVLQSALTCLINSVCVPVSGAGQPGWPSRLPGTQAILASALAAQDVPFPELVQAMGGPRGGRHPLYQVMFAYQDNEEPDLRLDGCTTQFRRLDPPQGSTELLAEFFPLAGGPARVRLVYQPARVGGGFAERLRDQYLSILAYHPPARRSSA